MKNVNANLIEQLVLIEPEFTQTAEAFKWASSSVKKDQFRIDKLNAKTVVIRAGRAMLRIKNTAQNLDYYKSALKSAMKSKAGAYKRIGTGREYPKFTPGMTTLEYIVRFEAINQTNHSKAHVLPIDWDRIGTRPAALYENGALDFDVIEEPLEDFATESVAQVVANAIAAVAISEAMAQTEDVRELVTCEAGENQASEVTTGSAKSTKNADSGSTKRTFSAIFSLPPTAPVAVSGAVSDAPAMETVTKYVTRTGKDALTVKTWINFAGVLCFSYIGKYGAGSGSGRSNFDCVMTSMRANHPGMRLAPASIDNTPNTPAAESTDTLASFNAGTEGISNELLAAVECATVAQVQALTDAQFSALYDHLENCNFHTENYLLQALRIGDASIIADMRQVMTDQASAGYLRDDIHERRIAIAKRMKAAKLAKDAPATEATQASASEAPKGQQVKGKSGKWVALLQRYGNSFALTFETASIYSASSYATPRERMAALKTLALAADAPDDTPPGDKVPVDADTPTHAPAVSSAEATPAVAVSTGFERVKPFNLNPLKLLEAGATTAQLIGLGVKYTGDMANPSGVGAITSVEDTRGDRFGHLRMMCLLEDGRTVNAEPHYFTATLRPILQFDGKMHGAPYLSELAMAAALAKSKRSSADELAKLAHDKALIDLAAKHPQLKQGDKHSGGKLAAVNARILLKQSFKGIKFSVRSDYNSMRIEWQDGPTDAQVNDVVGMFDIGASDTQSDYFYTVSTAFSDLFGGVQYLTTTRNTSDALIQEAIDQAFKSNDEKPTLSDWKTGANEMGWGDWKRRWVNEALKTISRM